MTGVAFTENWYPQTADLATLAAPLTRLPGAFLEIGTWEGRSAIAIANAIYPHDLQAVDWFLGDLDNPNLASEGVSAERAASRDVEAVCRANIRAGTRGNVLLHVLDWRDYVAELCPRALAFVHLDASHDYASVRAQIEALAPRLLPGGVLCGDDWPHPGVRQAVTELLPDHTANGMLWHVRC